MQIKTKDFQEAAKKILLATSLDNNAANLELATKNNSFYLTVTNKEFYVAVKFPLEATYTMRAVVDANLFLNLVAGFTSETFELEVNENVVMVKANKSSYKIPMIYENTELMELPVIRLKNPTVSMTISKAILDSIVNVNSKEVQKAKRLDVSKLSELYFIDQNGCFTFTTGACMNHFELEKPVQFLVNEKIVKLFKLFKEDATLSFGYDLERDDMSKPKLVLQSDDVYVAARLTCDDTLISEVRGTAAKIKGMLAEVYQNKLVISARELAAALSRIMLFTKNTESNANLTNLPITCSFTSDELKITDELDNVEVIRVENGSEVTENFAFTVNASDVKSILDSCKNEHLTINCGSTNRAVTFVRGEISNLIPRFL